MTSQNILSTLTIALVESVGKVLWCENSFFCAVFVMKIYLRRNEVDKTDVRNPDGLDLSCTLQIFELRVELTKAADQS